MNRFIEYQRKSFKVRILKLKLYNYYLKHILFHYRKFSFNLLREIITSFKSFNISGKKFKLSIAFAAVLLLGISVFVIPKTSLISHAQASPATASGTPTPTPSDQAYSPQQVANTGLGQFLGAQTPGAGFFQTLGVATVEQIVGYPATTSGTSSSNQGYNGGAFQTGSQIIGYMYDQEPESLGQYYAYLKGNAGFVNNAYADTATTGTGYDELAGIQEFWAWSRNIAYAFLALVLIIIAIIIMFKGRVGQMEVTVMNSLPRIAVVIVLITFSYAIAGLIIDTMNVGLYFVYNTLVASTSAPYQGKLPNAVTDYEPYSPKISVLQIAGTTNVTGVSNGASAVFNTGIGISTGKGVSNTIIDAIGTLLANLTLASAAPVILAIIIAVGALIALFKLIFALLSNYITLVILPIVAPFMFVLGALPGRTEAIGWWFKRMLSSALVFVAVYAGFLIVAIFAALGNVNSNIFAQLPPPLLNFNNSTASSQFIAQLIAYGLFVSLPKVPDVVEGIVGIRKGGIDFGREIAGTTRGAIKWVPFLGAFF